MLRGNGLCSEPELAIANVMPTVELALVRGELTSARQLADDAVAPMMGWHRAKALTTRAHVAIAQGEVEQAECDAHESLSCAAEVRAYQIVPDALEILAEVAGAAGGHREAARFGGAAEAIRHRMGGMVRFPIYERMYTTLVATVREAMGEDDFRPRGQKEAVVPRGGRRLRATRSR